ncbi:hypothetical protein, partial [Actinomadura sp. WAC 06369]|uniref:hypothetical protein n=1 Tax=Actinomadura sp. WAC 06369 TaxID=2203193 RepID=UPI0013154EE4
GTAAGAGGGASAAGFFASVGGKIAVGVAGAALVGGGVSAYAVGRDTPPEQPPTRPAAAAVAVQNQRMDGLPMVVRSQYVRVSGHRDPAVEQRINQALRSPVDWTIQRVRAMTQQMGTGCTQDAVVELTARIGIRNSSLISVLYPDNKSVLCFPADGELAGWAVTVDAETGRAYTADDIFKPDTLTPTGISTLLDRLAYVTDETVTHMWGPNGCARNQPPERSDFFPEQSPEGISPEQIPPAATVFFAPDRLVLNWSTEGSGCMKTRLAAPYAKVRDLLKPDLAAHLPA